jgi:tetratricopeptide (TPR) repeat protein
MVMRCLILFLSILLGALGLFARSGVADDADICSKTTGPEALAACNRVIASGKFGGGSLAFAHYNRGLDWLQMGELDRAIGDFDISIRLDPTSAWSFNNRGSAWYAKGDLDRAMADFGQAITLDPKYALAYSNRGEVWKDRGDFGRAIADYGQAISLDPAFTAAYSNRGLAYERIDDFERAKADFGVALSLAAKYGDGQKARDIARERLAALASRPPAPGGSVSPPPDPGTPGRRIALVIGNSAYAAVQPLANPRRDSEVIAGKLRGIGFQTVKLESDLTREKLVEVLGAFAREAQQADWAVVYFSGHGIEIDGANYLIPVDARLETDRAIAFEVVSLDQVMAAVEGARKLRLVLLDACRTNPFISRMRPTATRSIGRGFARAAPASGTLVVYAAKHGQVALDGGAGNSPFVAALAKHLATPGIEINKLFRLVRDDVMDATGGQQEPFTYGSLPGREDYYFVAK